jgi:hypothetical protein
MKKSNQNKRKVKAKNDSDFKPYHFVNLRVIFESDGTEEDIKKKSQSITDHTLAALEVAGSDIEGLKLSHSTGYENEPVKIPVVSSELLKNG